MLGYDQGDRLPASFRQSQNTTPLQVAEESNTDPPGGKFFIFVPRFKSRIQGCAVSFKKTDRLTPALTIWFNRTGKRFDGCVVPMPVFFLSRRIGKYFRCVENPQPRCVADADGLLPIGL
jgi:hypothetical protein